MYSPSLTDKFNAFLIIVIKNNQTDPKLLNGIVNISIMLKCPF